MATNTNQGYFEKDEHFLVTALAALPEIDSLAATGVTNAITPARGGVLQVPIAATDDDDVGAITFGALNWYADGTIRMQARVKYSAVTDIKTFIGFGDTIATADETSFSATAGAVTLDTMSNAVGFLIDGDDSTVQWRCVSGASDNVVINFPLGAAKNPVADTYYDFGVAVLNGGKSVIYTINHKEVYRYDSPSVAAIATGVGLVPGCWNYEQGVAYNFDIDRLWGWGTVAD